MLLSIGMIIKNEEKYLRDCLNGLKPILENLQSELIICDTGSTDNSVEIAKEFTDKVYQIEWRNDFARARNQTLNRAKGKWYMFMDADEIYTDVRDIIDFFESGSHKKYNCATIVLRNILNAGANDSVFTPARLFKVEKGMHWVGKIHEKLIPARPPLKDLNSEALHYGYNYESKDFQLAKHERNIVPLLEEFEKAPKDARTILHIINEYRGVANSEEEKKFIDIGLKLYEENDRNIHCHAIYHRFVEYHVVRRDYASLVEATGSYFDKVKSLYSNAPNLKLYETMALFQLKRFDEMAVSATETLDLIEKNEKGQLDTYIRTIFPFAEISKDFVAEYMFSGHALAGNFDKALEYRRNSVDVFNVFALYVAHSETPDKLADIYSYAIGHFEIGSVEYDNAITAIEKHLIRPELKELIAGELLARHGSFESDYMRLQRLRQLHTNQDLDVLDELDYFLKADKPFFQLYGDVLIIAIANNANFGTFLNNLHIANSGELFADTIRTNRGLPDILLKYLKASGFVKKCDSIKSLRVISGLISVLLAVEPKIKEQPKMEPEENIEFEKVIKGKQKQPEPTGLDEEKELDLFEAYISIRHKYLGMVYKEEIYSEEMAALLSEQDGFAYFAGRAYSCKDSGDTAGYAKNLRMALHMLPNMKDIITRLGNRLKLEQAATPTRDRLLEESAKLKTIIYTMIDTGNREQAAQILESYTQVNPTDPEIEKIQGMLA